MMSCMSFEVGSFFFYWSKDLIPISFIQIISLHWGLDSDEIFLVYMHSEYWRLGLHLLSTVEMALREQLDKFNKQQEKCQSTLSSISSSRTALSRSYVPAATTSQKPNVFRGKFSENTKQLQHITNIRNSAVGAQMKIVIDLLFKVCVPSLSSFFFIWA